VCIARERSIQFHRAPQDIEQIRKRGVPITETEMRQAAVLWLEGNDTLQIAELLHLPESVVFNRLREIRRGLTAPWMAA
jgi:hypothetical protein